MRVERGGGNRIPHRSPVQTGGLIWYKDKYLQLITKTKSKQDYILFSNLTRDEVVQNCHSVWFHVRNSHRMYCRDGTWHPSARQLGRITSGNHDQLRPVSREMSPPDVCSHVRSFRQSRSTTRYLSLASHNSRGSDQRDRCLFSLLCILYTSPWRAAVADYHWWAPDNINWFFQNIQHLPLREVKSFFNVLHKLVLRGQLACHR